MSGLRKAAVLVVKLGKEDSAKLLSHLPEAEVEELSTEIARLGLVDPDASDEILTEFHALTRIHQRGGQGGMDVAREMLIASLGEERAREIMDRLSAIVTDVPFSFLGRADPRQVVSFLQHEHPQTIALVLAHVPAGLASQVLSALGPEASDTGRHKVTSMLAERARENLAEEIELLGPVRIRMVEESQAKIVQAIRTLEDSGQIEIQRGGDDDEFVA